MKKTFLRHLFLFPLALGLVFSCAPDDPVEPYVPPAPEIVKYSVPTLNELTLEQKVGQMFNVRLEDLTGSSSYITRESDELEVAFNQRPCGGFTLFAGNIQTPDQLYAFTGFLHKLSFYPMLCIDEEGGSVTRIARNGYFAVPTYSSMWDIGAGGNPQAAYAAGSNIGAYLKQYGFDVDLAPVADVFSNPLNTVIGKRSFSSDPVVAADMSSQFLLGLKSEKVEGCLKHFPGHGDTSQDTHTGFADTQKTWEEMLECEMIPFRKGIENGARMIMTAHISTPNVTGNNVPATLSPVILTEKLRGELGFKGVIITDAMEMGAISQNYGQQEATLLAIKAGADVILCPGNYAGCFDAVVQAVRDGVISESRIDESVSRILALKRDILKNRDLLIE